MVLVGETAPEALGSAADLLLRGGAAMWIIAGLSVVLLTLVLWKVWRLSDLGVWRRAAGEEAMEAWLRHDDNTATQIARAKTDIRSQLLLSAMVRIRTEGVSEAAAREEAGRIAKAGLAEARSGLRAIEVVAVIAPLLGLLGTVLGMITAFQQLQLSGSRADPSALAGGVWEALLTTAAGMAVAIPAAILLAWLESQIDRLRRDLEDLATRVFTRPPKREEDAGAVEPANVLRRAAAE